MQDINAREARLWSTKNVRSVWYWYWILALVFAFVDVRIDLFVNTKCACMYIFALCKLWNSQFCGVSVCVCAVLVPQPMVVYYASPFQDTHVCRLATILSVYCLLVSYLLLLFDFNVHVATTIFYKLWFSVLSNELWVFFFCSLLQIFQYIHRFNHTVWKQINITHRLCFVLFLLVGRA